MPEHIHSISDFGMHTKFLFEQSYAATMNGWLERAGIDPIQGRMLGMFERRLQTLDLDTLRYIHELSVVSVFPRAETVMGGIVARDATFQISSLTDVFTHETYTIAPYNGTRFSFIDTIPFGIHTYNPDLAEQTGILSIIDMLRFIDTTVRDAKDVTLYWGLTNHRMAYRLKSSFGFHIGQFPSDEPIYGDEEKIKFYLAHRKHAFYRDIPIFVYMPREELLSQDVMVHAQRLLEKLTASASIMPDDVERYCRVQAIISCAFATPFISDEEE